MNVTLPDSMREWIEAQARMGGHSSPDGYVAAILREERQRLQSEIDQKLIEGLQSGDPIAINHEFWAERHRILTERTKQHAKEST